ncbi:MAG: thioredoxin-disulfide reductase [Elusimicrobia bacterium]|nr:thioredoxin-disulfide reductase [Elusimicrobiota bacterium]
MANSRSVVIIGSGPAAYTAAIYCSRAGLDPLVFGGVMMGGQLMITTDVENFPGFPEPVPGPDLMDRMRKQCERLGVSIVPELVSKADLSRRPFRLETTEGRTAEAETLIVATGADARWLGLESEARLKGRGVSACATCDGFFFKGKAVCVVGGGDSALEEALFLARLASKVTVVHRRSSLRASQAMQDRAAKSGQIEWLWDSVVVDILGSDAVTGLRLKNVKTGAVSTFPCQGVFVAVGHTPNTGFLAGQLKLDENGCIATDGRTRTSVPGVFAAGDVMDPHYRQAVTSAGLGCVAALEAERFLSSHG